MKKGELLIFLFELEVEHPSIMLQCYTGHNITELTHGLCFSVGTKLSDRLGDSSIVR